MARKIPIRPAFALSSALVILLATSTASWAQSAALSPDYGIKAGSTDVAFNTGWSNLPAKLNPFDNNSHPNFGGTAGVNLSTHLALVGEYNYQTMSALEGVGFHTQFFGGAARFSLGGTKVVPYLVMAGGGARLTGSESGVSVSATGAYVAGGGGANIYLGRNWGIRPEVRYNRLQLTFAGSIQNANFVQASTGIFFEFGGQSLKKKSSTTHP